MSILVHKPPVDTLESAPGDRELINDSSVLDAHSARDDAARFLLQLGEIDSSILQVDEEPQHFSDTGESMVKQNEQDVECYKSIAHDPLLEDIPVAERAEAREKAFELYKITKEYVAPVIASFADYLLREAGADQIIFAGRDGLGAYNAAKILKEKFHGGDDDNQLVYSYLTRRLVFGTPSEPLREYIEQCGVKDRSKRILLADVGMYGSILPSIEDVLPNVDARFLISRNPQIPGFAMEPGRDMDSMQSISGNPAVHFMEDTFSGEFSSPTNLRLVDGKWEPELGRFPPEETMLRRYAMRGIADYVMSLESPPVQPATSAISRLDKFLVDRDRYQHVMVPHHR